MEPEKETLEGAVNLLSDWIKGRDNACLAAIVFLVRSLQKTESIDVGHYLSLLDRYAEEGLESQPQEVNTHVKATLRNLADSIRAVT